MFKKFLDTMSTFRASCVRNSISLSFRIVTQNSALRRALPVCVACSDCGYLTVIARSSVAINRKQHRRHSTGDQYLTD